MPVDESVNIVLFVVSCCRFDYLEDLVKACLQIP
jgi:hypothetical protein